MKGSAIEQIKKRNGAAVSFQPEKIALAIRKALQAAGKDREGLSEELAEAVVRTLESRFATETPGVENVQDIAEETNPCDVITRHR